MLSWYVLRPYLFARFNLVDVLQTGCLVFAHVHSGATGFTTRLGMWMDDDGCDLPPYLLVLNDGWYQYDTAIIIQSKGCVD